MTTPTREELLRLAKEAGYCFDRSDYAAIHLPRLERFAALHAEWLSANQAQEPICRVVGFHAGHCVVEPFNRSMVLPVGMALYASHQAQGEQEPAGYMMVHVGGGDKGFAWNANSELFGPTWKRVPLYLAPPSSDQVLNEAIEAAKTVCRNNQRNDGDESYDQGCRDCATLLDSLKRPLQEQEPICRACRGNDGDMPCAYPSEGVKDCLRDARLASGAVDSQPSPVTDELPPLPEPKVHKDDVWEISYFTKSQMRAYARDAIALSRAQEAPAVDLASVSDEYLLSHMSRYWEHQWHDGDQHQVRISRDQLASGIRALSRPSAPSPAPVSEQPAAQTAGVPEGWKLVPIEPTWEIICAMREANRTADDVYRAAIAAAPQPVAQAKGGSDE